MARLERPFGIAGNLVVMEAITVHGVVDGLPHGFDRPVRRQVPCPLFQARLELRPVFDDEAVNGRFMPVGNYLGQVLAGQAVHQVQGQIMDASRVGRLDGRFALGCRMDPAQKGQHGVGKGLDAQTQAVDAAIGQSRGLIIIETVRIGFYRDFRIAGNAEGLPQGLQDAADVAGFQH